LDFPREIFPKRREETRGTDEEIETKKMKKKM
jgi:hypothetical protein